MRVEQAAGMVGTPPVLGEIPPPGLSVFFFFSICKVSEGVAETPEKH